MSNEEKSPLEYLSAMQDLVDLHEFMDDKDLGEAMGLAIKCLAKPDIPPKNALTAMLLMEAYAFKFRMTAQAYMTIKQGKAGTVENKKKNVYFAAADACHQLSAALKYLLKEQI